jgi:hypothetical protein
MHKMQIQASNGHFSNLFESKFDHVEMDNPV